MKRSARKITILLIFVSLLVCSVLPAQAFAAASTNKYLYTPEHNGYSLSTLIDNNTDKNPVGVRFYGFYFGNSDITVTFDIYSSPSFKIDFCINDAAENYTETQSSQCALLKDFAETVHNMILDVDKCANTQYDGTNGLPLSDIYRYNQATYGETLQIDAHTYEMLSIAREMYTVTQGAFNPAVYRLVDLWGFSSRIYSNGNFGLPYDRPVSSSEFWKNGYPLPEQKYIDAFSNAEFCSFTDEAVTLSQRDGSFYVTKNVRAAEVDGVAYDQWLDLGGIAKGYVVDLIRQKLSVMGIDRFNVDAGSSSMAFGKDYAGQSSAISLPDPFLPTSALFPTPLLQFDVGDSTVSTSGQYVRKYTVDGVEYSHIIDGTTGAPAQTGVRLVSVVTPQDGFWAGKSDCLTTALTVMGREKIVEFINGYLKDNGVKVCVMYQDISGKKNILSNMPQSEFTAKGETFDEFAWTLKEQDGKYVYDPDATAPKQENRYIVWAIVLGSVAGAATLALLAYHFVRGRKRTLQNVQNARRDRPFKPADVGVYVAVLLVIVVLFAVFFGGEQTKPAQFIKAVDMTTGETIFVYSATRNDWEIYDGASDWKVQVDTSNGVTVIFTKEIDGVEHFNKLRLKEGNKLSVKMIDSLCGFHQDCVHNFGEISLADSAIVCSPNRLKIISE